MSGPSPFEACASRKRLRVTERNSARLHPLIFGSLRARAITRVFSKAPGRPLLLSLTDEGDGAPQGAGGIHPAHSGANRNAQSPCGAPSRRFHCCIGPRFLPQRTECQPAPGGDS